MDLWRFLDLVSFIIPLAGVGYFIWWLRGISASVRGITRPWVYKRSLGGSGAYTCGNPKCGLILLEEQKECPRCHQWHY